jgi:serine protease Do
MKDKIKSVFGLLTVSLLIFSILVFVQGLGSNAQDIKSLTTLPKQPIPVIKGMNIFADIAEKVGPAVVNIDVVKMQKTRVFNPFKDFEDFGFGFRVQPEFKRFFEDKIIPVKGAGSGFIVNKKGHILTNEHVVGNADKIKVTLKDGRKFDAKLIGKDKSLDLAIIKIESKDLPTVILGDSNKNRPGEWVVAIGNPYGFANSVTAGIISATGRSLAGLGKRNLIQTDAAINPGNSGGPLINLNGKVIGINVAIVAQAQGLGFAIPINAAKEVMDELIKKGKVTRAWLGIYMRDIDEKIAAYLELPIAEGVVVTEVVKNSPAQKLGLKRYDILKEINGKKIKAGSDVQDIIRKLKPGETVKIKVFRENKNIMLKGNLGEASTE